MPASSRSYLEVFLYVGIVPSEEDLHFDAELAVLEEVGLEDVVKCKHLPTYQIRVLLQPLLVNLFGILLFTLVKQSISHQIIIGFIRTKNYYHQSSNSEYILLSYPIITKHQAQASSQLLSLQQVICKPQKTLCSRFCRRGFQDFRFHTFEHHLTASSVTLTWARYKNNGLLSTTDI